MVPLLALDPEDHFADGGFAAEEGSVDGRDGVGLTVLAGHDPDDDLLTRHADRQLSAVEVELIQSGRPTRRIDIDLVEELFRLIAGDHREIRRCRPGEVRVRPSETAVIVLTPTGRSVVTRVALPLDSVPVPSRTPFAKNWTVPVATLVPPLRGADRAVSVTASRAVGLRIEESVSTVVFDWFDGRGEPVLGVEVGVPLVPGGDRVGSSGVAEVRKVATPLVNVTALTDRDPMTKNWTVPVGRPGPRPDAATVAVSVRRSRESGRVGGGRHCDARLRLVTVTELLAEVLEPNVLSPRYWAVIALLTPTGKAVVVKVAMPLVPMVAVPSRSCR